MIRDWLLGPIIALCSLFLCALLKWFIFRGTRALPQRLPDQKWCAGLQPLCPVVLPNVSPSSSLHWVPGGSSRWVPAPSEQAAVAGLLLSPPWNGTSRSPGSRLNVSKLFLEGWAIWARKRLNYRNWAKAISMISAYPAVCTSNLSCCCLWLRLNWWWPALNNHFDFSWKSWYPDVWISSHICWLSLYRTSPGLSLLISINQE